MVRSFVAIASAMNCYAMQYFNMLLLHTMLIDIDIRAARAEQQQGAAIDFFLEISIAHWSHTHMAYAVSCDSLASLILRRIWNANGLEFRLGRAG